MDAERCSCGFASNQEMRLTDHLLEIFVPEDAVAVNGRAHDEAEHLACACGFTATVGHELDEHFLQAFTPGDNIGLDGRKHERQVLSTSPARRCVRWLGKLSGCFLAAGCPRRGPAGSPG